MPEKKKVVSFLPSVQLQTPRHQAKPEFFAQTRYPLRTEEAQYVLNQKAKNAALQGCRYTTECYRREGASLYAFAREVGISGNLEYAEYLTQTNPQAEHLIDELSLGFYAGSHIEKFNYFCIKYKSSFSVIIEHRLENQYLRKTALIHNELNMRLESARLELAQQQNSKKNSKKILPELNSLEENFRLLP